MQGVVLHTTDVFVAVVCLNDNREVVGVNNVAGTQIIVAPSLKEPAQCGTFFLNEFSYRSDGGGGGRGDVQTAVFHAEYDVAHYLALLYDDLAELCIGCNCLVHKWRLWGAIKLFEIVISRKF